MESSLGKLTLKNAHISRILSRQPLLPEDLVSIRKDVKTGATEEYTTTLSENVSEFLKAFAGFGLKEVPLVSALVPNEAIADSVLEVCKSEVKSKSADLEFYLALYLTLTLRFTISDFDFIPSLLSLFSQNDETVQSLVTITIVLLAKMNSKKTCEAIVHFLSYILGSGYDNISITEYSQLTGVFDAFFPLFPTQMKSLYTSDDCKNAFMHQVSQLNPQDVDDDINRAIALLKVVSLSCIDEAARKFNTENYLPFLINGTDITTSQTITALSLLCIVKLWNFSQIEKHISIGTVFTKVQAGLKAGDFQDSHIQFLLEALAYLSLSGTAKSSLRDDEDLIEQLLLILETNHDSSTIYGVLLVFANLSKAKEEGADKDRSTINYLKSVSLPGGDTSKDSDEAAIRLFNLALVTNHKLVGTMRGLDLTNMNLTRQVIQIVYNLCQNYERSVQREIVLQGGLSLVLKYLTTYSTIKKGTESTEALSSNDDQLETRSQALRALAIITRSVDPKVAFSEYDIKTAVPFLVELLGLGPEASGSPIAVKKDDPATALSEMLTSLDVYCGLLALTNLCSHPNQGLNQSIIRKAFEKHLKSLMIDSTIPDIQKAAWELVNNLILEPQMLAKFFNPDNMESRRHLDVMIKMLHSRDTKLQVVIGGLLANATMEYELVSQIIVGNDKVFEQALSIVSDIMVNQADQNDLLLRVLTFLLNLIEVAASSVPTAMPKFQIELIKAGLKSVLQNSKDTEVLYMVPEIVKIGKITF